LVLIVSANLIFFWVYFDKRKSNIASPIRKTSACFTKTKKLIYLHKCSQVFCAWKIQQTRHKLRHHPANLIVNSKVGPAKLAIQNNLPRTPSVNSILQRKIQNEVNNRIIRSMKKWSLKSCDKFFWRNQEIIAGSSETGFAILRESFLCTRPGWFQ